MTQQMQSRMPAHMQKYVGAFMQQNVIDPSISGKSFSPQTVTPNPTPRPSKPSFSHSNHYSPQPEPQVEVSPPPAPEPDSPPQPTTPEQAYDFIINPEPKKRKSFSLLSGDSSLPVKLAVVAGGLLILFVLFSIAKGLLSGPSVMPSFVGIAQDQQQIIHILGKVSTSGNSNNLSSNNQNFLVTAQLSLTSSQSDMIDYLAKNGTKVKAKQLNLKVSTATDTQLADSAAAATYDQTFKQIMETELNSYMRDLQDTYKQSTGAKGKALLTKDYNQAQLLLTQLETTSS